jgi:hypothetical protein
MIRHPRLLGAVIGGAIGLLSVFVACYAGGGC